MPTKRKITPWKVSIASAVVAALIALSGTFIRPSCKAFANAFDNRVKRIVKEETTESAVAIHEMRVYLKLQAFRDSTARIDWKHAEEIVGKNQLNK